MADAANQALGAGAVLAGTYEVTRLVGKGGMGSVWEARHLRLEGKKVAIKVLHAEVAGDAESVARFRREAQIASRLGHPNIVQVHDFNELDDGSQYLVLEYLEGESLAERLARGPVPVDYALAIVRQVSSALHAAHAEGIVHRDLKPHNIFLTPTETGGYATEQAKVLDFGISKIRGSQTVQTQASALLGTPQYMAPEQALGDHGAVDARTDIFALGAIVYEMLSGQPAFAGTTIPQVVFKVVYEEPARLGEVVPGLAPGVADAVHRAMAKERDQRFADVSAFVEALTGDPLITLRGNQAVASLPGKPLPPSASTSRPGPRAHSDEAFAHTVAPGQATGQELDPATDSTMAASAQSLGTAGTMAASAQSLGTAGTVAATGAPAQAAAAAPSVQPAAAPRPEGPARPRRSTGVVVALSAAAVIAAVVVAVVAMKSSSPGGGGATARVAEREEPEPPGSADLSGDEPAAAPQQGATGGPAQEEEDPSGAGEAEATEQRASERGDGPGSGPSDNAGAEREDRGDSSREPGRTRRSRAERGESDSGPVPAKLVEARKLFKGGSYDRAIRMARSSLGKKRTTAAYAVLTMSYCAKRDLGNARANFTHVKARRLRARVVRFCARHDIDLRGIR